MTRNFKQHYYEQKIYFIYSIGIMKDAMVEEALPDIEFEKIKVESRVQVKFALD
jgi:hypothetical protein